MREDGKGQHAAAGAQSQFARHLGARLIAAEPGRVEFEMPVTGVLANRNGVLHGGAIMALADSVGAVATVLNLPEGKGTTTLESKTNFIAAAPVGDKVTAICQPVHRGGRTMVWTTRIQRQDGRLVAVVTQTQMVLG